MAPGTTLEAPSPYMRVGLFGHVQGDEPYDIERAQCCGSRSELFKQRMNIIRRYHYLRVSRLLELLALLMGVTLCIYVLRYEVLSFEEYDPLLTVSMAVFSPDAPDLAVKRCTNPADLAPGRVVDAVYTWVNGSDPAFIRLRRDWEEKEGLVDKNLPHADYGDYRYREKNELLFSFRSIAKHAPWIRNIYIVSNSPSPPTWLDLNVPNVFFVPVGTLFPNKSHLPTFSSSAMQMHIHRISGLSKWFILLDDDIMFLDTICAEDFYTPERGWKIYEVVTIRALMDPSISRYPRRMQPTAREFDAKFGWGVRHKIAHVPFMIDKDIYADMLETFSRLSERTSAARFRTQSSDIMAHAFAYYHFLATQNHPHEHVRDPTRRIYLDFNDGTKKMLDVLFQTLLDSRPHDRRAKFLCINDNATNVGPEDLDRLLRCMCGQFPQPSIYEANAALFHTTPQLDPCAGVRIE